MLRAVSVAPAWGSTNSEGVGFVTTEAHLAFAGARVHSNNTDEMSAIVEVLSFLGLHGPVAGDACSCVL